MKCHRIHEYETEKNLQGSLSIITIWSQVLELVQKRKSQTSKFLGPSLFFQHNKHLEVIRMLLNSKHFVLLLG